MVAPYNQTGKKELWSSVSGNMAMAVGRAAKAAVMGTWKNAVKQAASSDISENHFPRRFVIGAAAQ